MEIFLATIGGTATAVTFMFLTFATKGYVDHRHDEIKDLLDLMREEIKELKQKGVV